MREGNYGKQKIRGSMSSIVGEPAKYTKLGWQPPHHVGGPRLRLMSLAGSPNLVRL